jgi:uncharacterized membrane protein
VGSRWRKCGVNELIIFVIVASIVGGGLVTGLLFAFSNFVMRALAQLPADKGMFAMQRINQTIINPLFLLLFLGTPLLCSIIAVQSALLMHEPGRMWLLLGGITYLIGPFGITMLFNVPLNNLLDRTDVSEHKKDDSGDMLSDRVLPVTVRDSRVFVGLQLS